ncbi:SRPBCC family protein [Streptomyces sp. NPDC052107]|uniref:SRPBCC family protein n=1 Tax=Streptomyces sp. NPDC052107 TaxID=3155632 RepID=UPI0034407EFB
MVGHIEANSTLFADSSPRRACSADAAGFAFSMRAWVDAAPARVYELVSEVAAISRWSPDADDVAFDPDAGPWAGAWFSGRNRRDDKVWPSRSQIVRVDPGTAFGFVVGGAENGIVHGEWTFTAQGRGTVVQQSWRLLRLDPVLGTTRADLDALRRYMTDSVETSLSRPRRVPRRRTLGQRSCAGPVVCYVLRWTDRSAQSSCLPEGGRSATGAGTGRVGPVSGGVRWTPGATPGAGPQPTQDAEPRAEQRP